MSISVPTSQAPSQDRGSQLFQAALLESERFRIAGFLVLLAVLLGVTTVRTFALGTGGSPQEWLGKTVLIAALGAHEFFMLRRVRRARAEQTAFPLRLRILGAAAEAGTVALAILWFAHPGIPGAYRPLVSPAFWLFFLTIILSTLQLERAICWLSGLFSAAGYLLAALYQGWRPPGSDAGISLSPVQTIVPVYALALLLAGFLAGFVAQRIKFHVLGSLREAETRRELDRVRHDLEIARSIQQSLLPRAKPEVAGFDIAGWSRPADETGGDYFDWNRLPSGGLAVMLTDVTGHGIGPALLAALCRAYARSAFDTAKGLAAAVTQLNRDLAPDLQPNRFATFASVVCCPNLPRVELLSAGHGPILLYKDKTRSCMELSSQSLPLGILPEMPPSAAEVIELEPGDVIVIATDGFVEWENDEAQPFGTERLEQAVRRSADLPPEQIIAGMVNEVAAFAGGTAQQDDLTAVVIKKIAA